MDVSQTLQQAIAALSDGDKGRAKQLLAQVLQADPRNESAWLWLVHAVDNPAHARECVERVLRINPENEEARRILETIRHRESRTINVPRSETWTTTKASTPKIQGTHAGRTEKKGGLASVAVWGCLIIILLGAIGMYLGDHLSSSPQEVYVTATFIPTGEPATSSWYQQYKAHSADLVAAMGAINRAGERYVASQTAANLAALVTAGENLADVADRAKLIPLPPSQYTQCHQWYLEASEHCGASGLAMALFGKTEDTNWLDLAEEEMHTSTYYMDLATTCIQSGGN